MTASERPLTETVVRLRRRIHCRAALAWTVRGLACACLLALPVVMASHLRLLAPPPERAAGLMAAIGAAAGAAYGLSRRVSAMDAARLADTRLGLRERLGTALELSRAAAPGPFAAAQIADAAGRAHALDIRRAFPVGPARELWWLAASASALLLALYAPSIPLFQSPRTRAENAALRREGDKIVRVARQAKAAAREKKLGAARQAAENLERLGLRLRQGRLPKKEAMVAVHKLTGAISEQHRRLARAASGKSLEQAARALEAGRASEKTPASAERSLARQAARALARKDYDRAASRLKELAARLEKGTLSAKERQALAAELRKMADAYRGTSMDKMARQLAEAARQVAQKPASGASPEREAARQVAQAGGT
ncbi:MAG: hypothetical protein IT210_19965 [Armatimonadetes bacterium]|nr:hypothetical protein [Armatimonadota bacterium]